MNWKSVLVVASMFLVSCNQDENEIRDKKVYDGPVRSATDVNMYYSESAAKKTLLQTPKLLEYQTGNREFPEGIYLEFFDEEGNLTSVLKANYAYFSKAENLWKATGDVEVKSIQKEQQLNSEELFWNPRDETIFTDKFVTIRLKNEVLYGTGLESNQDFTDYEIKNPTGDIQLQ